MASKDHPTDSREVENKTDEVEDLKKFGIEDEKPYQFNCGNRTWTPKCMQCINKLGWFSFFMCSMCIYQGTDYYN